MSAENGETDWTKKTKNAGDDRDGEQERLDRGVQEDEGERALEK